jgi:hypothetical protein
VFGVDDEATELMNVSLRERSRKVVCSQIVKLGRRAWCSLVAQ